MSTNSYLVLETVLPVQTYDLTLGCSDAVKVLRLKAAGGQMSVAAAVKTTNSLRDEKQKNTKTRRSFGH